MGKDIQGISGIATGITGARIAYAYDPQSGSLQIGLVANRKVRAGSLVLAEWDAAYGAGAGQEAIKLESASLNEGALSVSGLATDLHEPDPAAAEKGGLIRWSLEGNRIRVSLRGETIASLSLLDAQGRSRLTRIPPHGVSTMDIGLAGAARGQSMVRVKTAQGQVFSSLYGVGGSGRSPVSR